MTTLAGPPTGVELYQFRETMRRHAATVTVVTAPGDPPAGFTATSFTSVSLRPQLVSFCLDQGSSSWPSIEQARYVAIHLLRAGQRDVAKTFATSGIDRFAEHRRWRFGPYGLPILEGVLAVLICSVEQRIPAGDHSIVLGSPVSASYEDGEPLLYHHGGYRA